MSVLRFASRAAWAIACAATCLSAFAAAAGVRGIASESMPRGLYLSEPFTAPLRRGDTVEVCLPPDLARFARRRRYLAPGIFCADGVQRIVKAVLAVPGDTVVVTPDGFQVGGVTLPNTRGLSRDSHGRVLRPVPPGQYVVQPGTMWLFSTASAASFDSRYFGAVPQTALRRRYHPLWTESRRSRAGVFGHRQPPERRGLSSKSLTSSGAE